MSFRDTFTKGDQNEELLGYDDTAFYYFAGSLLVAVAVPWTLSLARSALCPSRATDGDAPSVGQKGEKVLTCKSSTMVVRVDPEKQDQGRKCRSLLTQAGVLLVIWALLVFMYLRVGSAQREINRFDPFEILEVTSSSSAADIKKAYRKLSLVYHPDKNPDDPLAASRFIQITKAYAALTDEGARKNFEKYGNPDGPQTSKVGIGLPRFLLEKDNQLMILCIFFFFLLFIVPMTFICYYQRTKNYAANGVMIETLQFLGFHISESTRVKNCPELLAASAESRAMTKRPTDNEAMKPLAQQVTEHKAGQFQKHPIIMRNSFLIWAHMQRLHHLMTPELRRDLDELLKFSIRVSQAMIEIACMREWFFTAQAMIDFRRSLVQALDVKGPQLLQVPHFNDESLKHCAKGKNAVSTLSDFLSRTAEQRRGLADMDPQQVADVEAFCVHVGDVEMKAVVEVEDEKDIVVGDIATVVCQLKRKNLRPDEDVGPVHAPLFPGAKYEEWWVFLVEGTPGTRILAYERIRDLGVMMEAKLRFQVTRPGKYRMDLHALCDSYAGIDKKHELNFSAYTQEEVKREIIVHKEDEDLDLQPTLFQQFMGDFGQEEESEEEEDEEEDSKRKSKGSKSAAGKSEDGTLSKELVGEGQGDDGGKESSKEGGDEDDEDDEDDSSASSSDSD